MTKTQLAACFDHVLRQLPLSLSCTETWNGFIAGNNYQACATHHHGRWTLGATDGHGIITPITEGAAHFFEIVGELPAPPTDDDKQAERRAKESIRLEQVVAAFNQAPARPFRVGDLVEWKPGLCNRNFPTADAVMKITDIPPLAEYGSKDKTEPNGNDPCDVLVAFLAKNRGREDDFHMIEIMLDSRRLQHWEAS